MGSKGTILIADDMEVNRVVIEAIFCTDYEVLQADNGEEALKLMHSYGDKIDVLLLDIFMPVMDGYEVLKAMKKEGLTAKIPVIVLSAVDTVENELGALELGATDFILKPFEAEVIRIRVANVIASFKYKSFLEQNGTNEEQGTVLAENKDKEEEYSSLLRFIGATVLKIDLHTGKYTSLHETYADFPDMKKSGSVKGELWSFLGEKIEKSERREALLWFGIVFNKDRKQISEEMNMLISIYNSAYQEYQQYQVSVIYINKAEDSGNFLLIFKNVQNDSVMQEEIQKSALNVYRVENEILREQAQMDLLTGVYNKVTSEKLIAQILEEKTQLQHGLFIIDLDNFKRINDNYGHAQGDRVLEQLGTFLIKQLRSSDIVGRIGGDEFIVLLSNVSERKILEAKARKFIASVKTFQIILKMELAVSISVGIAVYPHDGKTFQELYQNADKALYAAKNFGKNQFRFFDDCITYLPFLNKSKKETVGSIDEPSGTFMRKLTDIFYEMGAGDRGVDTVLNIAARKYGLDGVFAYDYKSTSIRYQWKIEVFPENYKLWDSKQNEIGLFIEKCMQDNSVWCCEDTSAFPKKEAQFFKKVGIKSLLMVQVLLSGKVCGRVAFTRRKKIDVWTEEEIEAAKTIAQLISKIMAMKKLESSLKTSSSFSRALFNKFGGENYVIDESFNVILQKDKNGGVMEPQTLSKCYELLWNKSTPCVGCPVKKLSKTCTMAQSRVSGENGQRWDVTAAVLDINEKQRNYIITRNHMLQHYEKALREIYDELYEFDVISNSYHVVYKTENKFVVPAEYGRLDEVMAEISDNIIHPEDKERFLDFIDITKIRKTFAGGQESMIGEFRKLWKDGKYHWSSLTILPIEPDRDSEPYLCFVMDIGAKKELDEITEQNRILQIQKKDEERYHIIVEQSGMCVFEWNKETNSFYSSKNIEEYKFMKSGMEYLFKNHLELTYVHPSDKKTAESFIRQFDNGKLKGETVIRLEKADNKYRWCKISIHVIVGKDGELQRIIGTILDVDQEVKTQMELVYRAEYDMLTGIYNQETFETEAEKLRKNNSERNYAITRMDVNRFKLINDLYGIEAGNVLLKKIASVLLEVTGMEGVCGRVNSDVFEYCMPYKTERELIDLTRRLSEYISVLVKECKVTFSYGICLIEDNETPINLICDRAYLALKSIKGNVVNNWSFYTNALRDKEMAEQRIENEMETALLNREFVVYLQPKYDIETGSVSGAESLVRWQHPACGIMAPNQFIDLFEKNGFIIKLDEYVWEETCRMLRKWLDAGYQSIPVSVNCSRANLYDVNIVEKLSAVIKKYNIPPKLLMIEITETVVFGDADRLFDILERLHVAGFLVSMDDFGSGFSSLNMLKDLYIDEIKLDRNFLSSTQNTKRGRIVIESVVSLAKQLDLMTVAEGVETKEQLQFLHNSGCDTAQGYYFSRPIPEEEFEKLVYLSSASSGSDVF